MLYDGTATVVAAGTKVPLATVSTKADWVTVFGSTVVGSLFVGGSTVNAASGRGAPLLSAGSANVLWPIANGAHGAYDLSKIYIDSTASSDSVTYIYGRS